MRGFDSENRLAIIKSSLDVAIMETHNTIIRDWLLDSQKNIQKAIWHIRNDKEWKNKQLLNRKEES
jgi:hypothetical protein